MKINQDTSNYLAKIAAGIALLLSLFQFYTAGFGTLSATAQRAVHLSLIMVLVFLWSPVSKKRSKLSAIFNILFALGSFSMMVYILLNMERLLTRIRYVDPVTNVDIFFGLLTIFLVLEATRRTSGWPLVIVALAALAYALFGEYLPGQFSHEGFSLKQIVEQMFLLNEGVFGIPTGVAATFIYIFILFGAFLEKSKITDVFFDLACALTGKARGGPAKIAIVSSSLFGTVSGSAPANVYATGTFSIPMMKRIGYRPEFAGAVEAVASTGGQIMPPVMGTAAFIMANITGIPYIQILKGALLPAILFYAGVFIMVHLQALKKGLTGLKDEEIPSLKGILKKLHMFLPLVILVYVLLKGQTPLKAAYIATLSTIAVSMISKETRFNLRSLKDALVQGARNALMVSSACASAGIVIGIISMTGIGFKFINFVLALSDTSLILTLIVIMLTSIVMGMGVPTAAAYIIVGMLAAPALIKMGISPLAAHLFVFYYAIISVITPPVALAAYAGAALAGGKPMETGVIATRLGIAAFIVPFMFIFSPALLLEGSLNTLLPAIVSAFTGILCLSIGLQGWFLSKVSRVQRILLIVSGLTLIKQGLVTDFIGYSIFLIIAVLQFIYSKKKQTAAQTTFRNETNA